VGELCELNEADSETLLNPDEPSIAMPATTLRNYIPAGPGSVKGDMKRTQRLSIEIQHREVTITVSGSTVERQEEVPQEAGSTMVCDVCGSPWVSVVVHGGDGAITSANSIHRALEQAGMHVQVSATGELTICRNSLEALKEKH